MNTLFLMLFGILNLQALNNQSSQCDYNEQQAEVFNGKDSQIQSLLPLIASKAQKNFLNGNQWEDFQNLVESNDGKPQHLTLGLQRLHGCAESLVNVDPEVTAEPGTTLVLKNFRFQMTYYLHVSDNKSDKTLGSIMTEKLITLNGNILINDDCESPETCSELVQVYIKNIKIKSLSISPVGGSTSAGGIIQFN